MKLFTVDEANALLPTVSRVVGAIQRAYRFVTESQEAARHASEGAQHGGGGMPGGTKYVKTLYNLAENASQLEALGVQIKDYERGLIDFPHLRDGRVVLLCWQLGEGERLEWWHETDTGFAGRQPL
jgi:hypothetical protein